MSAGARRSGLDISTSASSAGGSTFFTAYHFQTLIASIGPKCPLPDGLPRSVRQVAGENGPAVRRAFGHAASPRRSARHPGLPVSRARRSLAAPPDCALVCFGPRPKRSRRSIRLPRPVAPFACSRRANLPSKHTHMSAEAYPPDGPQISPPQGSQNFSARAAYVTRGGPLREGVRVVSARARKTFAPGKPAASPSLTQADSETGHSAMPPHSRGAPGNPEHLETRQWLTIKRTPMRPSNFSA